MDSSQGSYGGVKIIRPPNMKRTRMGDNNANDRKVKLEKIFGVTLTSPSALATDPNQGVIAYPAGCTVVLYHPHTRQQSFIVNPSKKSITTLAFSSCGRYLVTGETGHQPAVRVWDLVVDTTRDQQPGHYHNPQQIASFFGHKFGVGCVAFSPSNKIIVSVGSLHDMIVNVWDWRNNIKVASNKVSTKVKAIAFAENGSYFVTVGNRLVKFWYFDCGRNKYHKEAVPLMGRSAILGEQRNNNFVDVACGRGEWGDSTYAITRSGVLCEFNNRRLLAKWVLLNTGSANSVSVGEKYIFVGCDNGIVRCFEPINLNYVTTLPRTHYLGVDVSLGLNISHLSAPPPNPKYPDVMALSFDDVNNKVTCVYNDHSIYIWDVDNIHRVGKADSFLFHSACIWGVEMAPQNCPLPSGSFLTCSSDDTIRVWTLNRFDEKSYKGMYVANIYSRELLKVIYVDPEMNFLKDKGPTQDGKENAGYDSRNGVRSIRLSPDGKQLASGDRIGKIRIHETTSMSQLLTIEAHNAEVLSLEFSGIDANGKRLLASASRDRLIHVFDVNRDFNFLQTLDDHSSSITSVRFLNSSHGNLQMISCGADKSIIFRSLAGTPNGTPQFQRSHNATGKNTLYDMEVDVSEKHVLTACQDRNVRVYNVVTGKLTRTFKGSMSDEGSLIKVALDKSGTYLATSSTDKTLSVYDCYTGECMATMSGHSELATGLRFTNDCKRIISTSGDGCIFVWRVPYEMVVTMHERHNRQVMMHSGKHLDADLFSENDCESDDDLLNVTIIRRMYSSGKLPAWAKKKMKKNFKPSEEPPEKIPVQPKGRWAERAAAMGDGSNIYSYFSDLDSSLESDRDFANNSRSVIETDIQSSMEVLDSSVQADTSANIPPSLRNPDPDLEAAAHDADVDSDHDYRQQSVYYPSTVDSASGSEFTVTNIDADELRKSVRRSKRSSLQPLQLAPAPLSTGTGSQESDDDDDDEASTPSGENTDANPMSMLSTSMESLYLAHKDLQSTYESLSGNELDTPAVNKSSISAQYHTRRLELRNVAVVNAARQTKNDVETVKKREQLNKMIADTKKKLQSIGYVSPLKTSQSICDLSHVPEKETRKDRLRSTGNNDFNNPNVSPPDSDFTTTNKHLANQLNKNTLEINLLPSASQSTSVPNDLQLCGCYMREIQRNLTYSSSSSSLNLSIANPPSTKLSDILSKSPEKHEQSLAAWIEPRRMHLDRTLNKNKMHKSLPVSPVSEECKTFEFHPLDIEENNLERQSNIDANQKYYNKKENRKSFSYFLDLDKKIQEKQPDKGNDYNFKQICDDIEKFSQDFSRNYQAIEDIFNGGGSGSGGKDLFVNSGKGFQKSTLSNDDKTSQWLSAQFGNAPNNENCDANDNGNFSSDSLEDCSFNSVRPCKKKHQKGGVGGLQPPRRCVSNNELYNLTQGNDLDYDKYINAQQLMPKSQSQSFYLNQSAYTSQESILSSEDNLLDRRTRSFCNSMESILSNESDCKSAPLECLFRDCDSMRRSKSCNYTLDIPPQRNSTKLSKTVQTQTDFETPEEIVVKKSKSTEFQQRLLRFEQKKPPVAYFLETAKEIPKKTKEIKEKMEIPTMQFKNAQYKSKYCNVLNNKPEQQQQVVNTEKQQFTLTTHNLPSSNNNMNINLIRKNKNKLQETASLDRHLLSKGLLESEKIYHKPPKAVRRHSSKTRKRSSTRTTYEYVKKEDLNKVNLENSPPPTTTTTTSIEFSYKENNTEKDLEDVALQTNTPINTQINSDYMQVQNALKNIKILNGIQEKITAINGLIDLFKTSLAVGKVKALSSMYENLSKSSTSNNIYCQAAPPKRNISLPDFCDMKYQHDQRNFNLDLRSGGADEKFFKDEYNKQQYADRGKSNEIRNVEVKTEEDEDADCIKTTKFNQDPREEHEAQRINTTDSAALMESRMAAKMGSPEGSMRRACSLSDLSHQRTPTHDNSSNSTHNRQEAKYIPKNAQIARLNARHNGTGSSSPMMRSSSTSVLNRSDSDDGGAGSGGSTKNITFDKLGVQSRLMRPTISSQNKVANSKNSLRKRHSHSTLNLSPLTREDSSSEESELPPPPITKPIVPPRTRLTLNPDNHIRDKLNNDRPSRAQWGKPKDDSSPDAIVQESKRLYNEVAANLTATASEVVKLYDNLMYPQSDQTTLSDVDRSNMGNTLLLSAISTVKILHEFTLQIYKQDRNNADVNLTDSVKKLNDLIVNGFPTGGAALLNIMQQYLDIMLAMAQQNLDELNK